MQKIEHQVRRDAPRRWLGRLALLVAVAALGGVVFALGAAGGVWEAQAPADKPLRIGVNADPATFDPFAQGAHRNVYRSMFETLLNYDAKLKPVPLLASSWKIAPNHYSVVVTVRKNVRFHNGKRLTARDVEGSFRRALNPTTAGGIGALAVRGKVASVKALNASRVRINLTAAMPTSAITDILEFLPIMDVSSGAVSDLRTKAVGTGPFELGSRSPGRSYTATRFAGYWGPKPRVRALEFKVIPNADTRIAALQAGDIDVALDPPYSAVPRATGRFNVHLNRSAAGTSIIILNANVPPLNNEQVRYAIQYAVNRRTVATNALFGLAEPKVLPWVKSSSAADPRFERAYAHNPAKARALLASSGIEKPKMTITTFAENPDVLATAQIVKANLDDVGFEVDLQILDITTWLGRFLSGNGAAFVSSVGQENKYPTALTGAGSLSPATSHYIPKGGAPYWVQAVAGINALLTPAGEKDAFLKLNTGFMRLAVMVPLTSRPAIMLASRNVAGVAFNTDALPYFGAARFTR